MMNLNRNDKPYRNDKPRQHGRTTGTGRSGALSARGVVLQCLMLVLMAVPLLIAAPVQQQGVPTLVPPTLVPTVEQAVIDALPSESGVARIQSSSAVRIGILYNEPPFGELSLRTDESGNLIVSGFDADLGRAMADAWGVTPEFVQVTRQTAVDMVVSGQIDLLLAAQPHLRDLDQRIEFSHTYYPSVQAMLVRQDDGATGLAQFADRRVGVVMGTRGQEAVNWWLGRVDYTATVQPYYNLDAAIAALLNNEVDGVVENRLRLTRAITPSGTARILDEPVMPEAYAIGLRRQDVNLRNLVDKTLQFLLNTGRIDEIHRANFAEIAYPPSTLITWANLGDEAPRPDQFATDVPLPSQYVVPRLQSERVVRVAGITDLPPEASESERRLDAVNRTLVNAMAERWGVSVVLVPSNGANPLDLVASGQADLAVNVTPDWNSASSVDFTGYYLMHGLQLMVEVGRNIGSVADLRNKAVGVFNNEQGTAELLRALAQQSRAIIDDPYPIREADAAFSILAAEDINLDAVFGDSMKLVAHLEQNPDRLALVTNADGQTQWYNRYYVSMAVPRNDIDFRLLVDYTLQEMVLDGTLQSTTSPVLRIQDVPRYDVWPGSPDYLGFNLRRAR